MSARCWKQSKSGSRLERTIFATQRLPAVDSGSVDVDATASGVSASSSPPDAESNAIAWVVNICDGAELKQKELRRPAWDPREKNMTARDCRARNENFARASEEFYNTNDTATGEGHGGQRGRYS